MYLGLNENQKTITKRIPNINEIKLSPEVKISIL